MGVPSSTAAAPDEGFVAPFPTTCCTSRADDGARSYERRKLTRTFIAPRIELGRTAACLCSSDFPRHSRDSRGCGARNRTRSKNLKGQAAKKMDARVQQEDFPG
ncbi:hypothetical protein ACLOJK_037082, partial [Asimina triloba]